MRVQKALTLLPFLLPFSVQSLNIVLSNDDSWSELNLRMLYDRLTAANHSVVISAPADNKSGQGSKDVPPIRMRKPCQHGSCWKGDPAIGYNKTSPRFSYVNSYPVTAMRYGIQKLSPIFFAPEKLPDIALVGPNVGPNVGHRIEDSGTVGAAVEAVKEGIPAIAFSGHTGRERSWRRPSRIHTRVYSQLALNVTQTLTKEGKGPKPYLPEGTWLNVNFGKVADHECSPCANAGDYQFIFTRIWATEVNVTPPDVVTCKNEGRLPTEEEVFDVRHTCYATISVAKEDQTDADADTQKIVLDKMAPILSCLYFD